MTASFNNSTDLSGSYEHFRHLVKGTNINGTTLLATDYLNHFNEVIMLVDMIGDMPDFIEDIAAWTPKTYQDHFRDSVFSDKDLAVAAYDHVPPCYRQPFELLINQLNTLVLQVAKNLVDAVAAQDEAEITSAALIVPELHLMVEKAGGVINGERKGTDQADIDAMLKT